MRNIVMASISAMGILASTVAFADGATTKGNHTGRHVGTGSSAGAIAESQSISGAASLGNQIGSIGDNINSTSKSEAEPAIAPNLAGLYASPHTCMGSATASVGVGGVFSAGVGNTYQDDECNKREAVKLAAQLGLKQAAAAVFYDIEVVRNVVGTATNAGDVARAEASQLAGVQITPVAATRSATRSDSNGRVAPSNNGTNNVTNNSNRPYWCANVDSNNARWDECE